MIRVLFCCHGNICRFHTILIYFSHIAVLLVIFLCFLYFLSVDYLSIETILGQFWAKRSGFTLKRGLWHSYFYSTGLP